MLLPLLAAIVTFQAEPPRTVGKPVVAPPEVARLVPPEKLVSRERLEAAVKALPTKRAGYPTPDQRDGLLKTQNDIIAALKEMGYEPQLSDVNWAQRPKPGGEAPEPLPWKNIAVDVTGRELPNEMFVFGAHFDAVPSAPGADDNGTGVAALLEMARLLKDRPMKRTIRLVFFNLEESGLIGSRQYCERLQPDVASGKIKILGMASFDELGYFSDKPDSQRWPDIDLPGVHLPTTANFIAVGGLMGGRTYSQPLIAGMKESDPTLEVFAGDILPLPVPDFLRSDHAPFLALGVPAVIISDTANFRNPHYHQPTDTIETLDFERFTKVTRQLVGAAWRLGGPLAPGGGSIAPEPSPTPAPAPPEDPRPTAPDKPLAPAPGRAPETPRGNPTPRP